MFPEEEEWKRSQIHKSNVYVLLSVIQKILTNEKEN